MWVVAFSAQHWLIWGALAGLVFDHELPFLVFYCHVVVPVDYQELTFTVFPDNIDFFGVVVKLSEFKDQGLLLIV